MSKLSETLKKLRKAKGLSQMELAKETNLSVHAINSYESGRREPNSKAMATLESYFHVTGEYLRGESSHNWEDPEILDAVKDTFPLLISRLINSFQNSSEIEKKMLFDIMTELCHIAETHKHDSQFRTSAFFLMQENFTQTTRFIDFCSRFQPTSNIEFNRLENYKDSFIKNFEESLSKFQDSLNN